MAPGQEAALQAAYAAASADPPAGLVRSELLRDVRDATWWRIQTWWMSREALQAVRRTGTPSGLLMFHAAGAEPTLEIFEVVNELEPSVRRQP